MRLAPTNSFVRKSIQFNSLHYFFSSLTFFMPPPVLWLYLLLTFAFQRTAWVNSRITICFFSFKYILLLSWKFLFNYLNSTHCWSFRHIRSILLCQLIPSSVLFLWWGMLIFLTHVRFSSFQLSWVTFFFVISGIFWELCCQILAFVFKPFVFACRPDTVLSGKSRAVSSWCEVEVVLVKRWRRCLLLSRCGR